MVLFKISCNSGASFDRFRDYRAWQSSACNQNGKLDSTLFISAQGRRKEAGEFLIFYFPEVAK